MKGEELEGVVNHIEINVNDLQTAIDFYGWFLGELGYEIYQQWPEGRSWRLGSTYFVVAQVDPRHREPSFHRRRPGLNHLAFHAGSKQRIEEMEGKLKEKGIPLLYGGPEPGDYHPYAIYFEGPERIKLEYVWQGEF
jgi:catechol 2,3-dioxygenase-like lactoylglutathione lyase family enzyme